MIVWTVITTDGGRQESRGRSFLRPSEAREDINRAVQGLHQNPSSRLGRTTSQTYGGGKAEWEEFGIEVVHSGDSVLLAATPVVGTEDDRDWPLQPGQVKFVERMLNEIIEEVISNV